MCYIMKNIYGFMQISYVIGLMIWVNGKLIGFLPVRRLSTGSPEKDLGQGKFKLANSLI